MYLDERQRGVKKWPFSDVLASAVLATFWYDLEYGPKSVVLPLEL